MGAEAEGSTVKKRITFYIDRDTGKVLEKHMKDAGETNVTAMLCRMIREYGNRTGSEKDSDLEDRVAFLEAVCRKLLTEKGA